MIVTDGTTLLGADDKAGIAEIMTMAEYFSKTKEMHGDVYIGFNPDEEIGNGLEKFSYEKFKKGVNIVKFLILELIAKCNDSSMRAWQFHNLLKTFPTIYPAIAPTIEDEQQAFANLFDTSAKQS